MVAEDETGSWIARAAQDAGGNWRLGNTMVAPEEGTIIDVTAVEEFGLDQWRVFATVDIDGTQHIQQWRSTDVDTRTRATTIENPTLSERLLFQRIRSFSHVVFH